MKAIFIVVLAAVSVLLVSLTIQQPDVKLKEYKPANDFKWLNEPCFMSRCVNMSHWESDKDITFDSVGIIKSKGTYHPVVASQYALVCFDTYMKTKDKAIKEKFLNQIKYLTSPKRYTQIGENSIGYPYSVAFHDLTAPWYSGLAQSEVLGVLVRYYSLTKDKSILPLMFKVKNFITVGVDKKGLLNTTAQGCTWIEEYPNSKQHLHVLNGFMVTVIFLEDYCRCFPDDIETRELVNDCYESVRSSIIYYDTGTWLKYDRGTGGDVKTWYMKAQVIEIEELYAITRDEFFKKASLLWGTYSYNKAIGYRGCLIDSINYSVPCDKGSDGVLKPKTGITVNVARSDIKSFSLNGKDSLRQMQRLFDGNMNTTNKVLKYKGQSDDPVIQIDFVKPITFSAISLKSNNKRLINYGNEISFTYQEVGNDKWKKMHVKRLDSDSTTLLFKNEASNISSMQITFNHLKDTEFIDLSEIQMKLNDKPVTSEYAFYQTDVMSISSDEMKFVFNKTDVDSFAVFVKTESSVAKLNLKKYDVAIATLNKFPKVNGKDFSARFLIVFKRNSPNSSISNLHLE